MHFKLNTVKKSHTVIHPRTTVHSECESARHSIPVERQIFPLLPSSVCLFWKLLTVSFGFLKTEAELYDNQ